MSSLVCEPPYASPAGSAGGPQDTELQHLGCRLKQNSNSNNLSKKGGFKVLAGNLFPTPSTSPFSCRWDFFRGPHLPKAYVMLQEKESPSHIQGGPGSAPGTNCWASCVSQDAGIYKTLESLKTGF